jgi:hypothetical protein
MDDWLHGRAETINHRGEPADADQKDFREFLDPAFYEVK